MKLNLNCTPMSEATMGRVFLMAILIVAIRVSAESLDVDPTAVDWGHIAVHAGASREIVKRAEPITIAIIDTGADLQHPLLKNSFWKNPGETGTDAQGRDKSTNGIDDDKNGYVDDVSGWNFASGNNDLSDHHGHGTHIAGLIGAATRAPSLQEGIAPGVRLMILKYYDPRAKGADNLKALIEALHYATLMKVRIINYSGGGAVANTAERASIRAAHESGILVVAAAGNEAANSDLRPFYPADYGLPNVLSVGAHDSEAKIISSSNFGLRSVDFFAPGDAILSTMPMGQRGEMTGTSQATAFVTGAAALLLTQRPDLTDPAQVIAHLRASVHFETSIAGRARAPGRLDLLRTLAIQDAGRSFSGYRIEKPAPNLRTRIPAVQRD